MNLRERALTLERRINRVQRTQAVDRATAAGIVLTELAELRAKGHPTVLDRGARQWAQIQAVHAELDADFKAARGRRWTLLAGVLVVVLAAAIVVVVA